jgi:hypothetical protein
MEKSKLKIYFHEKAINQFLNFQYYYSFQSYEQFIKLFLLSNYEYEIINRKEDQSDIVFYDIHLNNNHEINEKSINILLSIENVIKWPWYEHYNEYGEYGNKKIDIYFYNHISKIVQSPDFLSIPTIYLLIDYFIRYYSRIKPEKITTWQDKKFCLLINKSNLNEDIYKFSELLKKIGQVDNISYYNDLIQNKSCYYSIELLNVFNQYKFILCFENSYQDGYITEKIFNCFFARTIPIYRGASNVNTFFNEESFINANYINKEDDIICFINKIKNISENKDLYLQHINSIKISKTYDDENYKEKLSEYINKKYNKK